MGTHKKNPNAAALGSLGGKARAKSLGKNGLSRAMKKAAQARMNAMTHSERKRVARQAAKARWAREKKGGAK